MKANRKVVSVDEIMDVRFGKVGTPERNLFREEAKSFCEEYGFLNDIPLAMQKRAQAVDSFLNVGYQNVMKTAILLGLKELEMKISV